MAHLLRSARVVVSVLSLLICLSIPLDLLNSLLGGVVWWGGEEEMGEI